MTDQPDLFADLPPPSGPKIPEPTEDEITASIEETRNEDGLDLPQDYVRDMLAGRDPTNPAEHRDSATCGACGNCQPCTESHFCEMSALMVGTSDPINGCQFFKRRK